MAITQPVQQIVEQKLAAFERLQPEFEECFQFVEEVQGQKRFSSFATVDVVRYLHALWVCEVKSNLLSVSKTVKEYDGRKCLELLRKWQLEDDTASVVAFLYHKLDMLPVAEITEQIQAAVHEQRTDHLAERLLHGRSIMLNRGFNLMQLLDALFAPAPAELHDAVHYACQQYGHLPEQIDEQLKELDSPLYAYVPHQSLAQRNMLVMNKLGINSASNFADLPKQRTAQVEPPTEPFPPFAEHVVKGYQDMNPVRYNNINHDRFVDPMEQSRIEPR